MYEHCKELESVEIFKCYRPIKSECSHNTNSKMKILVLQPFSDQARPQNALIVVSLFKNKAIKKIYLKYSRMKKSLNAEKPVEKLRVQ